jgi:hypothetical protein
VKQLSATAYARYGAICKALRAKGTRLGFLEMSNAAEIALLIEEGDTDRATELARRLDLDPDALPESCVSDRHGAPK